LLLVVLRRITRNGHALSLVCLRCDLSGCWTGLVDSGKSVIVIEHIVEWVQLRLVEIGPQYASLQIVEHDVSTRARAGRVATPGARMTRSQRDDAYDGSTAM
jgi:hypothetical protein